MFKYFHLPYDLPIFFPIEAGDFKCLVLVERIVGAEYRQEVSEALVKAGCLYCISWGVDCSAWDDSVDAAASSSLVFDGYFGDRCVMTTWHENETLEETVSFAKHCTDYTDIGLDRIVVLDFSAHERGALIEQIYHNS